MATDEALRAGTRVGGRYEVVELLARGAMGQVYRARGDDGVEVALKRVSDRRHDARFEIEARVLARLSHPGVVGVIGQLEDSSGAYLVMELIQGRDLGALLDERGGGLPVEQAIAHARQACEAVQYIHSQGVVHRDVKPRNLILSEGRVVLVDFGIARELDRRDAGTRAIGTPLYMAPEVLVGESVSPRSDVYSLAATTWALIAGEPPAYHDQRRLEGVPPAIGEALARALELRPERRLASAAALASALGSRGESEGRSLAVSAPAAGAGAPLLEAIVRTAAGVFEAAAASIALVDETTTELVYEASWGAGADEIVGVRLPPGAGIAGAAVAERTSVVIPDCRADPRFEHQIAAGTGYVPHTMLVSPLRSGDDVAGTLSILDRRDGRPYGPEDIAQAELFAELVVAALP